MLNEKMEKAFLEQINKEFYSEYLYLSMRAYFLNLNLKGFANWMDVQAQEEHAHGIGIYNYIIQRNGKVILESIKKPEYIWSSPLETFKAALAHEQYITSSIDNLANIADEVKDRASSNFIDWYIKEQIEEQKSIEYIISQLEMISESKCALITYDKELLSRTFIQPIIN